MSKVNQLLSAIGFGLFSYLFLLAAGYSLTHLQTLITLFVGFFIYFTGRKLLKLPDEKLWTISILILIIGGILRFTWAKFVPTLPVQDFAYYHQQALAFAQGNVGADLPKGFLYPLILSLGYRIHPAPIAGRLLNALASTISIGLVFYIAKELINLQGAAIAAFLFALLPSEIHMVSALGTEVMTTTILLITVSLCLAGTKNHLTWRLILFAGLFFGIGYTMRVSLLFYLPVLILLIVMVLKLKEDRIKATLAFLAGILIMLILVVVGHSSTIGKFSFQAVFTHDSYPFLSGTNIDHSGQWNQEDVDLYSSWPVKTRDALARKEAFNRIRTDLLSFGRVIVTKMNILFRDNTYGVKRSLSYLEGGGISVFSERWIYLFGQFNSAMSQAIYVAIWGLGIIAFWRRKTGHITYLILGMVLFTILPHTILEVQARYHHYIMPFVILAASSGLLCLGSLDLICQDDNPT